MIIHNIEHKLCISMSILLALSVFLASSILFASNSDHIIRLVPGQEIYFSDYNIKCFKHNSYINNNTKYLNKKNIHFKGKAELQANNIKLGKKAFVKIDNFKVKCLASNVFQRSNKTFIDYEDDDINMEIVKPTTSFNTKMIEILLDDESEKVHPKCEDENKFSIFEEYENTSSNKKSRTSSSSSIDVRINLDGISLNLFN